MDAKMTILHHDALIRALEAPIADLSSVSGGFSPAQRWRAGLRDGRSVFLKVGTTPTSARALRRENQAYDRLAASPAPVAPRKLGFVDDPHRPVLILEDLTAARWPPPWMPEDLPLVRATIDRVAALPGPWPMLPVEPLQTAWHRITADPAAFLSTRVCTPAWLDRAADVLKVAALAAPTAPSAVVHFDLRGDNLCFVSTEPPHVCLIDWNHAGHGPHGLDLAFMAPSLRLEGGPLPDVFAADECVHRFAAWVAGFFAERAGQPAIVDAPRVRPFQHRQLRIALPWAARVLGLPPPDGDWAQQRINTISAAYVAGEIDDGAFYRATEENLVDAYLATDNPRAASGKSGDAAEWKWARGLILDACPTPRASVLDVGCANGHLMASLEVWGEERGFGLQVHGLEISARLAEVARRRLPHLADRIYTGNVATWHPPRCFELVHLGLDYVPPGRQKALIERVRARMLAPGGRIVLRPERVSASAPNAGPAHTLRALGFEPGGVIEARHPTDAHARRQTAWLDARI